MNGGPDISDEKRPSEAKAADVTPWSDTPIVTVFHGLPVLPQRGLRRLKKRLDNGDETRTKTNSTSSADAATGAALFRDNRTAARFGQLYNLACYHSPMITTSEAYVSIGRLADLFEGLATSGTWKPLQSRLASAQKLGRGFVFRR